MPGARRRVRRVAPRHRRVPGCGRARRAPMVAHQRPRSDRARARAVHAPARRDRCPRRRRHHRVVGRSRSVPGDAERVEHRAPVGRRRGGYGSSSGGGRGGRRHLDPRRARRAGTRGAQPPRHRRRGKLRASRGSRWRGWASGWSPAPATPARTASRSRYPPSSPPTCGTRSSRRASRRPGSARATRLRLEAGLPLHGHELGPGITPLQAGLGWVVRWDKGDFRGRAALDAERERGVARRLRGITVEGRRPARDGDRVLLGGAEVGTVTSGNFSPTFGHAIALAFLRPDVEPGAAVQLDVRGQLLDGRGRQAAVRQTLGLSPPGACSGRRSPTTTR